MGISIHHYSAGDASAEGGSATNLAAALRMDASGILGTTVQYGDLVSVTLAKPLGVSQTLIASAHV